MVHLRTDQSTPTCRFWSSSPEHRTQRGLEGISARGPGMPCADSLGFAASFALESLASLFGSLPSLGALGGWWPLA